MESSQKKLILKDLNLIEEENNEELDFYNLLSMRQKENEFENHERIDTKKSVEDILIESFNKIDKDNSGFIDKQEFISFLKDHFNNLTEDDIISIFKEFDGDIHDDKITFKEFKMMYEML